MRRQSFFLFELAVLTCIQFVYMKKRVPLHNIILLFINKLIINYLCLLKCTECSVIQGKIGNVLEDIRTGEKWPEISVFQCFLFVCSWGTVLSDLCLLLIFSV